MDFVEKNSISVTDKKALDMFYKSMCSVLKRDSRTYEQLRILESIGSDNFGLMRLGCLDSNNRGYLNFVSLMNEYGIKYVEQRVAVSDSPYESVTIALNREDIDIAERLRVEALRKSLNFRISLDADVACNNIANSDKINDKSVVTIKNLNLYEKELLKIKCQNISPAFNLYEAEKVDNESTLYDVTLRDSKIMNINDRKNDFCKAYLETVFSLYGYNGNYIIDHLNADIEVQLTLEENKDSENTLFVVGANEKRIKHYTEINPDGFQMYLSTMKDGRRTDVEMQPIDTFKCSKDSEDYDVKLQNALNMLPSKVILTSSRDLNNHLTTMQRNVESIQPVVGSDEKIIAEREKQIVELIDQAIKDRLKEADEYRFLKTGQEKFSYYVNDAKNILTACIYNTKPTGYDSQLIMIINSIADLVGMNLNTYKYVLDVLDIHEATTHIAKASEKPSEFNDAKVSLKTVASNISKSQSEKQER